MKIGIIGTGSMGCALARAWAGQGCSICLGSRRAERGTAVAHGLSQPDVTGSDIRGAAAEADVIVLAVPWKGVAAAITAVEPHAVGKLVIDCTNPMVGAHKPLIVGRTTSGAEEIQAAVPRSRVVKAFNAIAARVVASRDPLFFGVPASIFHCGDDAGANEETAALIRATGFDPQYAGALSVARYLEPLAAFTVLLDAALGGRTLELVLKPLCRIAPGG